MAADAVGTGPTGVTNGAIGSGVIAFRMKVVSTAVGAPDGTVSIQIGARHGLGGVGVINSEQPARRTFSGLGHERLIGSVQPENH